MPEIKIISTADIGRCPKGSLLPQHYRDDGTCLCSNEELDDEQRAWAEADEYTGYPERQVWNTAGLQRDFAVEGFQAPYVVVTRKSDGKRGSLRFNHRPRVYYAWQEHTP